MDPARRITTWTEDEYLERERKSPIKNEFFNGQIFAMAGASFAHNAIASNALALLHALTRGKACQAFNSDQRIWVETTGLYTYADAGVVCGKARFHDKDGMTLLNPMVLVEVLSDATQKYDRETKSAHYRKITTVREVLLIAQAERLVERYQRTDDGGWVYSEHRHGEIELPSLGGTLSIADLYDKIDPQV
jgi:Uma2 family endonuclease